MSKSIAEQIRAAVERGGGQAAVARTIREAGGKTTQPLLSGLCNGQMPSLSTLREISRAVGGWVFTVDADTDVGASRAPRPSEKK